MERHLERVKLAEELGFAAVWLRDVPLDVPSFGDVGQIFDPFVYLGALAATTQRIALGVASVILPLRHPAHVGKAAASVDVLSGGRLLLGVASGDRPEEYPALGVPFEERGQRFRESVDYLRATQDEFPSFANGFGELVGAANPIPKPHGTRLPLLITGSSRQSQDWVARHGDGWMTYPRSPREQAALAEDYRRRAALLGAPNRPVMQSLYVDLVRPRDRGPRPIHLGFQSGVEFLRAHLRELEAAGINHVALNLRFNADDVESTMARLAEALLPDFGIETSTT